VRILITGACGFAGSHLVEELLQYEDIQIVSLDRLTYAGRLDRLEHLDRQRIQHIHHDFRAELPAWLIGELQGVDYIIHNGAETHVGRSFGAPELFIQSNIVGTFNILESARKLQPKKFVYVSTDEVFGPDKSVPFKEDDVLNPTNPYAATKACGELLAMSHHVTFGVPVVITRTMNMFGERQHPEKFVPLAIRKILRRESLDVHANEKGEIGLRQWLHARVQSNAISYLLKNGVVGERYNVSGTEFSNLEIAQKIAGYLDLPLNYRITRPDAPVHDFSYNIDGSKLRAMGWKHPLCFGPRRTRNGWNEDACSICLLCSRSRGNSRRHQGYSRKQISSRP